MPVEIPLTRGLSAIIDKSDLALIQKYRWWAGVHGDHRYARTEICGIDGKKRRISLHRMILGFPPIEQTVDHIDSNGLNNCRSNLRLVSRGQNRSNSIKRREATCAFKGVYRVEMRWRAQIVARDHFSSEPRWIGDFDTAADAARAYDAVARVVFGEHARLNFPRSGEFCAILEPEAA